ncbi:MAG TPA: potassium-transporting ATPase subunit KdpC [Opitutaceae bacterium]|nr:potassium-transporting ATPase subunit KdpC [Opitutaceae bacterium]
MKSTLTSALLFLFLTLLCGLIYPLAVTGVAALAFSTESKGSLVKNLEGKLVGSRLLAQKTTGPRYFWPRPSAGDYATIASAASNLSATSDKLRLQRRENAANFRRQHSLPETTHVPADMVDTSGSGLDPDISLAAAQLQVGRVAHARQVPLETIQAILERSLIRSSLLGDERVNVLTLNLALEAALGSEKTEQRRP